MPFYLTYQRTCRSYKTATGILKYLAALWLFIFFQAGNSKLHAQANIVRVEYFIDTDPGYGNASSLPLSPGTVISNLTVSLDPGGLSAGIHSFIARAMDANGNWSLNNRLLFIKPFNYPGNNPLPNITYAEWYVDNDPGYGNAHSLALSPGTNINNLTASIDTAGLTAGIHSFIVRARDAGGNWGLSNRWLFIKPFNNPGNNPLPNIVYAEWYIDNDPGYGNAHSLSLSPGTDIGSLTASIDTAGLTAGLHSFIVRARDAGGNWSLNNRWLFIKPFNNPGNNPPPNITYAEWYIDNDPGYGNAHSLSLSPGTDIGSLTASVDTAGLAGGIHSFIVRARDAGGNWSLNNRWLFVRPFHTGGSSPVPNLVYLEYYIDTDPGPGKGVPVSVTPGTDWKDLTMQAPVDTFQLGLHLLNVRAKDANGSWSLVNSVSFQVNPPDKIFTTFGKVQDSVCTGSVLAIPFSVNQPFGGTNVFTAQLSDKNGSFANPVNIGSLSVTGNDTIHSIIPAATPAGFSYAIRLVSTSPIDTEVNAKPLIIERLPEQSFVITGPPKVCLGSQSYAPSNLETGVRYLWQLSAGGTADTSGTGVTINWTTPGNYILTLRAYNDCGMGPVATLLVAVSTTGPSETAVISNTGRLLNASTLPADATNYQWYLGGAAIAGATGSSYYASGSGVYSVKYSNACGTGPSSNVIAFSRNSQSQAITFQPIPPQVFGAGPVLVNAAASSMLPVIYTIISGPAGISGDTVIITGAGTVVVEADQRGDTLYDPAGPVQQSFIIDKAAQTLAFDSIPALRYGDAPYFLKARTSSGLPVNFSIDSGNAVIEGAALVLKGSGMVAVKAAQPGNNNYYPANELERSVCVGTGSLSAIAGPQDVCPGTVAYIAGNVPGLVYTWQLSGGGTLLNTHGDTAFINWLVTGNYVVSLTAAGNCGAASAPVILSVNVHSPVTPDAVRNMLPADSSQKLNLPVTLSWLPAANSDQYDLYLWPGNQPRPDTPYIPGIRDISTPIGSGLTGDLFYQWQVVSKNNCLHTDGPIQRFSVAGNNDLPDLTVSSIQFPADAIAGKSITVSWTVNNIGTASTNNSQWSDYIYLSTDKDLRRADDILLGAFPNQSYLQPGQSYTQTRTVAIPPQVTGTYYLFVITSNVDAVCWTAESCDLVYGPRTSHSYGIRESNQNNNYKYGIITLDFGNLPDLQVSSIGIPSEIFSGDTINVSYKVTNTGALAATGMAIPPCPEKGWYDRIFISPDSVFDINHAQELSPGGFLRNLANCTDSSVITSTPGFLSPDSSYFLSVPVLIPYTYSGGYYIYVIANGYNEVFEGPYAANNISRSNLLTVNLTPPADLAVSKIMLPSTAIAGQKITLGWTVINQGASAPREYLWTDSVYLCSQKILSPGATIRAGVVTYNNQAGLPPGATYSQSLDIVLPDSISGNYYAFVKTDAANQVFEGNFKNNNTSISDHSLLITLSPAVDLVVTKIQVPDSLKAGQPFTFKWSGKNQGPGKVGPPWSDNIYCAIDSTLGSANLFRLGTYTHSDSLASGQETPYSIVVTIPSAFAGKSIYFFVFTDALNQVFEYQAEDNNWASSAASVEGGQHVIVAPPDSAGLGNPPNPPALPPAPAVSPRPDLRVVSFNASSSVQSGNYLAVNWKVINQGAGSPSSAGWNDDVYLSADTILDATDIRLSSVSFIAGLPPGQQYADSASVMIPYAASGNQYLLLLADATNSIKNDSIAANNFSYIPISITSSPNADLAVTNISFAPSPLYSGAWFYLKYTVKNIGSAATNTGEWYDGAYFSPSATLGSSSGQAASRLHNGVLQPGGSYTDSVLTLAPPYLTGNYYLILRTDNQGQVYEGSAGKANNTYDTAISILPLAGQPASDLVISSLMVPDSALLGKNITASYSVKNIGQQVAAGVLTDALYLSTGRIPGVNQDNILASRQAFVTLRPGDSVFAFLSGIVSVPKAGNYYGIVRTNILDALEESDLTNNSRSSDTTVAVDAVALPLNISKNDSLPVGNNGYYKITVQANTDLLVSLTSSVNSQTGNNVMYIAYDRVPTPYDYDATTIDPFSLNQQMLVSGTQAGNYYLLAASQGLSASEPVTLLAQALPFSILRISPGVAGRDIVTTQLYGAGFTNSTKVVLLDPSNKQVSAATLAQFTNSMQLALKWDLTNVADGVYTVAAINPDGKQVVLVNGLTVQESTGYSLEFTPLTPNQVRTNQTGFFTFKGRNKGNIDIPVVQGDFSIPGYATINQVVAGGNAKKQSQYYQGGYLQNFMDWYERGGLKVIPFVSRNLAPNQEFVISFNVSGFQGTSFPIQPRMYGMSAQEFFVHQLDFIETFRIALLNSPSSFGASSGDTILKVAGSGARPFAEGMLLNYFDAGILFPGDTVGVNVDYTCSLCLRGFNDTAATGTGNGTGTGSGTAGTDLQTYTYSPATTGPGLLEIAGDTSFNPGQSLVFRINKSLYWPGYTGATGKAGQDPGWDLYVMDGKLNINSSTASPFSIYLSSLSYNGSPGILAGWYPAGDTSWAMIVAKGGITGFSADKFTLDASNFLSWNNAFGGYFYLSLKKGNASNPADTLFLSFKAYRPKPGEPGVPGAPGVPGEPGSPGGNGGDGNGSTTPGDGGPGGSGGAGGPGQSGGSGGQGGAGGNGGQGQSGGNGGRGGNGGAGGDNANGGNGGQGGLGGNGDGGGNSGNGGQGGNGGDSGGGGGTAGTGGSGGDGLGGPGSTGTSGGGATGSGAGERQGNNCDPQSEAYKTAVEADNKCRSALDAFKLAADKEKPVEETIDMLDKATEDDCEANSALACASIVLSGPLAILKTAEGALETPTTNSPVPGKLGTVISTIGKFGSRWVAPYFQAVVCGLKIGDCINQKIYGTKYYPGYEKVRDMINGATCGTSWMDMQLCIAKYTTCTAVRRSCDPNEIIGPPSYGAALMVSPKTELPFSIHFENDSSHATTAAQKIVIRQKIHPHLNPLSFRLGSFGFGNMSFNIPNDQASYFTVLNLADSLGYNVEVTAGLDVTDNELFWVFQAIDPSTGLPPADPLKGFLPVDDSTGVGQGFVNYTIQPVSNVTTGDTLTAQASIFFDNNDPVLTNTWLNTFDAISPMSKVKALPAVSADTVVTVSWSGKDDARGSGIHDYSLYVSSNNGSFTEYGTGITDTSALFAGSYGNTYSFFTLARDNVGNIETMKTAGETSIQLIPGGPLPVTWLYFRGEQQDKNVVLDWATAIESNTASFIVERSTDGRNFSDIGAVKAAGNSTQIRRYQYIDQDAIALHAKMIYYRIRQVDLDDKFVYSNVVAISLTSANDVLVVKAYPNPFVNSLSLLISAPGNVDPTDRIEFYTMDGRPLYHRSLANRQNNVPVTINDLPELAPGIYVLKVYTSGNMTALKIIRQ